MDLRRLIRVYVMAGIVVVVGLVIAGVLIKGEARAKTEKLRGGNTLGNPPGMVDHLSMADSAADFQLGAMDGVDLITSSDGVAQVIMKEAETKDYPKKGTWTSPEQKTEYPFTELIPSWNLKTPGETGVYFEVRVHQAADQSWSPWMYIGYWGRVRVVKPVDRFDGGYVNSDNLILSKPADAYQMRAVFQSFEPLGSTTPALRRVSVCYSGVVKDDAERQRLMWKPEITGTWAVDLAVPYRAQGDSSEALSGQICSPTSTSMVMQYFGQNFPTVENAQAIYDNDIGIFGNWGRAVARAGEMGLDSWIMRFRNWDQVKAMISQGQPIICSIRAKKGDFQGPHIYDSTGGHLIVIRGLTADGGVIVNDPARRAKGNGFVYNEADMQRVWIDHGGVAYIIHKPSNQPSPATRAVAIR